MTILEQIVAAKRIEITRHRVERPVSALRSRRFHEEPRRGFERALREPGRAVVAEVKKASPSRGVIREDFRPVDIALAYAGGGARAISVLTDEPYFQGRLETLEAIRAAVSLPLLRKDFVLDPYQVEEARAFGADAILLICAILDDARLRELGEAARALDLDVLVEVHTRDELERALRADATLVGINNRDLRTFETRIETSEELARELPEGVLGVAESGLRSREDLERLERAGIRAFLIGESLVDAASPGARLLELLA